MVRLGSMARWLQKRSTLERSPFTKTLACLQAVTGCFYRGKPGPFANRAPSWVFKTRGPGDERASPKTTIARPAPPGRVFSKMAAKIANSGFSRRRKTPTPTARLRKHIKSQSMRGSRIFGNGQKQPYLKLCLLKASHEQVIKSTLFCLLLLMWSRDRQFKFDPPGSHFGSKNFPNFTNFACLSSKQTWANHKSNDVSLLNWPFSL